MLPSLPFEASSPASRTHQTHPDLYLFLEFFAREGGIQSYVHEIFRGLHLNQQSAEIFLLRDAPCSQPFNTLRFRTFQARSPQIGRLRFTLALLSHLIRRRPHQVFCGHIHLAPLVWMLCKPLGVSYTVMTYGKEVWSPLPRLTRRALQQANQIWTISRYSREQSAKSNQLDLDTIKLLPCPVDGEVFTPGPKSPELQEKYGLASATVLMTVARLWSGDIYKGVDVTIRALPQILTHFPNVKYLVVGRGDDQPRLAKLAADLGVADQVIFAGFVPTEALADHYRLADLYVMPSQEGFGIVYLEAMACGIPVIAGDADGSADPLQDGQLGWQVPHRDPQATAAACLTLLTEIAKRERGEPHDRRCDPLWLRQQTLNQFGRDRFVQRLHDLIAANV